MSTLIHTRRQFLQEIGLGAAAPAVPRALLAHGPRADRLNNVFIFADDLGQFTVGAARDAVRKAAASCSQVGP